jgi:hypothetical protein
MLDKEPRWLHPRTRTDMDRRMSELERSPVRHTPPDGAFSRPHAHSLGSSAASYHGSARDVKDETGLSPNLRDLPAIETTPVMEGMEWTGPAAAYQQQSQGAAFIDMGGFPNAEAPQGSGEPNSLNDAPGSRGFSSNFLRRSTVMTTSTDMTTTTLQQALSQYSIGFVRNVKKVIKRYTMPAQMEMDTSPISEMRPQTADSTRGSWLYDENSPATKHSAGHLPGDFLNLDTLLDRQGFCIAELPEHNIRSCLCFVRDEVTENYWVTDSGPASQWIPVLQFGIPDGEFHHRDPFSNTPLHLLAARDVQPQFLLRAVHAAPPTILNAKNNAGQTFLHLLGPSWFSNILAEGASLQRLLHDLQSLSFDIYARDIYGRSFFHILQAHVQEPSVMSVILRTYDARLYCRRDAFDIMPAGHSHNSQIAPLRKAHTSVMEQAPMPDPTPAPAASQLRVPTENPYSRHAQLLEFVRRAELAPNLEDSQGRNGLHCLAAAILSPDTLLTKFGNGETQLNRKRKRDQAPPSLKKLDSSKDRLTLRESILKGLIDAGVDVNHYDADGNTVLMAFVAQLPEDDDYKVPVSILQMLIEKGADLNARNRAGETALHVAVRRGRKLAMRTLVNAGASVHARDGEGRSVLDVADLKIPRAKGEKSYAHYEACRAWLSGQGRAVQSPTVLQEWGYSSAGPAGR